MEELNEFWKTATYISTTGIVETFELYEVSTSGDIRRVGKEKCLKGTFDKDGYLTITLERSNGTHRSRRINRLVASTFIPCPDYTFEVNHLNEIKTDNRVDNLNWLSKADNNNYGTRTLRSAIGRLNHPNISKEVQVEFEDGSTRTFPSAYETERTLGLPRCTVSYCLKKLNGRYRKLNLIFRHI